MADLPFGSADLETLKQWDTPTICNALEITNPERRSIGFTTQPLVPIEPKLPPVVGLARVGMIRAKEQPRGKVANRLDWGLCRRRGSANHRRLQDLDDTRAMAPGGVRCIHGAQGSRSAGLRDKRLLSRHRCLGRGLSDHWRLRWAKSCLGAYGRFRQAGKRPRHERRP